MEGRAAWYEHPQRFPKNAPGPFYTLGYRASCRKWCGECMSCEAPEAEAPDLLAPLGERNFDTYFVRQPTTPDEVERACRALEVCCVSALRYGGTDQAIIRRLGNTPELSDYVIIRGRLVFVRRPRRLRWWERPLLWLRSWLPSTLSDGSCPRRPG
jgi:hypothetical protein